ncbi:MULTISPECIES: nuclear transport factor 2 family protein [Caulobacter]|jgi:ketosteroid isomerase-like protein|uniref:Ketosteroid isomerase-like protein n=1 Tax=Caulobacter vibrioides OR37 TaxID=1292034 RepID=R0ENR4_CAUVI|nr:MULTISPECIES: nuclear transport factor 2 family protein [Caulobacter]ENZ83519.1 ketosteroid isomerase-like protein [Caulobacter vibrioides OR37]MBQ1561451.1 nuclear transport factor 2 family protein [Caulobacter sp.]
MSKPDYVDFAKRFVAAIQDGDGEAVRAFYAPDAKLWHNTDNIEQTVDQNLKVLAWFVKTLPDRFYRVLRVEALPDGFVQQHILEATLPNGEKWAMDACVVVKIENGLITRLDEYLDSAKSAQLRPFGR